MFTSCCWEVQQLCCSTALRAASHVHHSTKNISCDWLEFEWCKADLGSVSKCSQSKELMTLWYLYWFEALSQFTSVLLLLLLFSISRTLLWTVRVWWESFVWQKVWQPRFLFGWWWWGGVGVARREEGEKLALCRRRLAQTIQVIVGG